MKTINPDDKQYYDKKFKVSFTRGIATPIEYIVYANSEQGALDEAVAYMDQNNINNFFYDEEYERDLTEVEMGNEDESTLEDYLYVDATINGASQLHYVLSSELNIAEVKDEDSNLEESKEMKTEEQYTTSLSNVISSLRDAYHEVEFLWDNEDDTKKRASYNELADKVKDARDCARKINEVEDEKQEESYSEELGGDTSDFVVDMNTILEALNSIDVTEFAAHKSVDVLNKLIETVENERDKFNR